MADKERLDILVFQKGFAESREKAKAIIMAGDVYVDNQKADKPGVLYPKTSNVEFRGKKQKYVSRGGLKLEKGINKFNLDINGKICMDIGASTGGFTDCMLQNGAKKVYAVDVGYGQLAWKLRNDGRVVNMEKTNIRYVTESDISDKIQFFSIDVAFISLKLILPVVKLLAEENAEGVFLIKPQFEAGKDKVKKNGVVRDKEVHIEVVDNICKYCLDNGFSILNLDYSPIKGPEGNIEYLIHIKINNRSEILCDISPSQVVENSHIDLDK